MAAVLFDTHEAIKELHDAGIATPAAEAVVRTFQRCLGETVATKADIAELRADTKADIAELKADFAELRADTKADIAELRADTKADIAELKADFAELRATTKADIVALETRLTQTEAELKAHIAEQFRDLYKYLWLMAAGIVALNVTLTVTLTRVLS